MNRSFKYTFTFIEKCNMCGSDTANHIMLGRRLRGSQKRNPKKKIGITTTIAKCPDCNLVYSNPMPIPMDIQDHYGVLPESYWKEKYFKIDGSEFSLEVNKLKTLMQINAGSKSLDIGAGIGKSMIALERAGFESYGIEPSESFYKRAIEKMGIKADKIKLSSIENADFPAEYFDFIAFSAVLEHLYDPARAIQKAMTWLKPDGIIYIEVPSSKWLVNKLINLYYRINGTDFVGNLSPMHAPYHLYEFGIESFYKNSDRNNYKIIAHDYWVCPTYLPKAFDFILKPYMQKTGTGMQLTVWLKKHDTLNN